MEQFEKVCKGLEVHIKPNSRCVGCPYPNNGLCVDQLYYDAIALIRQQQERIAELENVPDIKVGEWTTKRTNEHDGEWYCSNCGYEPIVMSDDMQYCPGCGAKMKMPEPPKEE